MEPIAATVPRSLQRVLAFAHANLSAPLPLEQLAAVAGLSQCRFALLFRRHMGMPPRRYISRQRVRHAKALLRQGVAAVNVADACGFYDQSHLSRHFKNVCGMTPGEYLRHVGRQGAGHGPATPSGEASPVPHHPALPACVPSHAGPYRRVTAARTEPHRLSARHRGLPAPAEPAHGGEVAPWPIVPAPTLP
ncbi:helix-turn-helix domain-containing protein [Frateuria defendens]|uniref:helix-turn-helix domain-containing protein n=1 Tax=Frateuria defendens TaxID=2219559 RepID=UPI0007DC151C|nr:AraC family transcriptional regulator [Frateuria defendens]